MYSLLPRLCIIDLQLVLMVNPHNITWPLTKVKKKIFDKNGTIFEYRPEIPAIFNKLKTTGVKIVISYKYEAIAFEIAKLFGWKNRYKYISFVKEYPDKKDPEFLLKLKHYVEQMKDYNKISDNVDFKTIYLTHFEDANTKACMLESGSLLVQYIDPRHGLTMKAVEDVLKKYQWEIKLLEYVHNKYS